MRCPLNPPPPFGFPFVLGLTLVLGLGVAALLYGALQLGVLADAAGRPAQRVTLTSCTTVPAQGKQPATTTCHAPATASGDELQLPDTDHRAGQTVTVRCTGDGTCEDRLGYWAGSGLAGISLGLLLTVNGLAQLARSVALRYAPARAAYFRRRSTARAVLGFTCAMLVLLLAAVPIGLFL